MANPTSALGQTGWLMIFAVIGLSMWSTGKGIRDTLYYKYRPANLPYVAPTVTSLFWISVLVLYDVSWVYAFIITSNTGNWVNNLFKNSPNSWDTLMSLYLVTVILLKMWNPWVYFLDKLAFYWYNEYSVTVVASAIVSPSAASSTPGGAYRNLKANVGTDNSTSFWSKNLKYHTHNYVVKVGMGLYALALIALTATITGFYSNPYKSQHNDHYFKIIYWTAFVGLLASVLGFLFILASSIPEFREKDNEKEMESILDRRNEENASG